ncbi:aldehyde dehydrogenase family protein [Gluconacetobacter takamatsuzukensis]|uniref:Aldehyde dehydrogenase family protein n=1 Tax=Gluconacetobacter takamatsuzukensis TaxID=1286190 RepID=A0A7W4PQ71_9PROT|nr:aldehyde dehydrogenase family protein [Gluconacetobacter takamatsuzukensis]MBB2206392.1 aldehyde dehydrogenase family protein [Gluconacetobacter takamatsuzukensis]
MNTPILNIIDGTPIAPDGSETWQIANPARLDLPSRHYALSSPEQVDLAVAAAHTAQKIWAETSPMLRADLMMKAAALIAERQEELALLITREMGKPLVESRGEVGYAAKILQFYAAEAQRPRGETLSSGRPRVHYYTVREPIGVIGAITPWNFPLSIACWKIGPAIMTGNTVVWKPSPQHPLCSQALMQVFLDAGLPNGVVNMLHGAVDAGSALVAHPGVQGISFTGSSATGEAIYQTTSARLARAQCEMGGKNVLYVHESGDLQTAVTLAIEGAFRSAGQKCTGTSWILLDPAIADPFIEAFLARARALDVGDPELASTFLGPVADVRQFTKVCDYIEAGIEEGLALSCGGLPAAPEMGYFIAPTVFTDVPATSRLAREEIFGPVVAITRVADLTDAIDHINTGTYGLSNTIIATDLGAIQKFSRKVESGVINVNLPTAGVEMHAPFGGWKRSGLGAPEQGLKTLDFYTHWRSVAIQSPI